MSLYTVVAFKKVERDLQKLSYIFNALAPFLTLAYLCYALIVGFGNKALNIVGASLSSAYFIYYIMYIIHIEKMRKKLEQDKSELKTIKANQRNTKRIYKICKILVGLLSLTVSVYTVYVTLSNVTPLSVLLVGLSAIAWVLNLIIFLAYEFFSSKVEFIVDGIKYDFERINPVKNVKDIITRAQGREVEIDTEKISLKNRNELDRLLQKDEEERVVRKAEKGSVVKNLIKSVLKRDAKEDEIEDELSN